MLAPSLFAGIAVTGVIAHQIVVVLEPAGPHGAVSVERVPFAADALDARLDCGPSGAGKSGIGHVVFFAADDLEAGPAHSILAKIVLVPVDLPESGKHCASGE